MNHPPPEIEASPKCCHRVAAEEEATLRKLLLDCGYTELWPESQIERREDGRLILGGCFLVEDRPGKYRLICERLRMQARGNCLGWLCRWAQCSVAYAWSLTSSCVVQEPTSTASSISFDNTRAPCPVLQ